MKKCQLPSKPAKEAGLEFDCKEMVAVLKRVDSVTRFSDSSDKLTHIHLLVSYDGHLFVIGRTPDTFVAHHIPNGRGDADTVFNIDPAHMIGVLSGRGPVVAHYSGKDVKIEAKTGKYKTDFKIKPLSAEQIPMVAEGLRHHLAGGHVMSREVIDTMSEGVRACRLKDVLTNLPVLVRVECLGDSMRITSPGNWTSARYLAPLKTKTAKFRFSLSGEMFDLITKFCADDEVTFHADGVSFAAEAAEFVVTLPPIQATDNDYRFIDDMLTHLGKPLIVATIKGDISAPFSNISTLVEKNGNYKASFKLRKKEMVLKFASDKGSVSDSVPLAKAIEKEVEAYMDVRVMKDILRNVGKHDRHLMGLHGSSIKDFKALTLTYKTDAYELLYFGYVPK